MKIEDYLARIGHVGPVAPDLKCLRSLHRGHVCSIPYENIDVQLGRRVSLDVRPIFDKLVSHRRGGWCFEMNGLFHWVLHEIGFDVTRMVGGFPQARHESVDLMGNHLALRVELAEPWLVDVGLGNSMQEPIPLRPGGHECVGRTFRLSRVGATTWRFKNHEGVRPPGFDFDWNSDESRVLSASDHLQDDEHSVFRQNLICQRFGGTRADPSVLLGRVLSRPGHDKHIIENADELVAVLNHEFGIEDPELRRLWPAVAARHHALFSE